MRDHEIMLDGTISLLIATSEYVIDLPNAFDNGKYDQMEVNQFPTRIA